MLLDRYSPMPYTTITPRYLPPGLNQWSKWSWGGIWLEAGDGGHLTGGKWLVAWSNGIGRRTIAIEQYCYWSLFKLVLAKNI